ncbi:CLUMA_CG014071, isoform A [Clunio marinus]|uniref:CLUMA_CG014071, isoform A n=1 Tax=Clunio marinus TaxID=568069 RepID=A0A1J1IMN8_9DIPT|nr:CLUMA_CG014071, isoform A [Clunio marinus]
MRFIVLLLTSMIAFTSGEVLKVACGDETCENPSNKAVTTLRYQPDESYKLQINAVNSEVEIYGKTNDFYYIKYGKKFGFLPKHNLREKMRGKFTVEVELDLSKLRIDEQVKETNFLHEYLKLSKPNASETSGESSEKIDNHTDQPVNVEPAVAKENDNRVDKVEATNEMAVESEENDSGIEDDDETDEDDNSSETLNIDNQVSQEDSQENNQDLNITSSDSQPVLNDTETLPVTDNPPNTEEVKTEDESKIPSQNEMSIEITTENVTETILPLEQPEVVKEEEEKVETNTIKVDSTDSAQIIENVPTIDNNLNANSDENVTDNEIILPSTPPSIVEPEPIETTTTEPQIEIPSTTEPQIEMPSTTEAQIEISSTTEPQIEIPSTSSEPIIENTQPEIEETTTELPQIEIPVTTEQVKTSENNNFETTTEIPKVESNVEQQEIVPKTPLESPPPPQRPNVVDHEPDALMQRFNKKLGDRIVENTGKGSIEPIYKPGMDHHDHHHHHHDVVQENGNNQKHDEVINEPQTKQIDDEQSISPEIKESEDKPGFFAGLFKSFFSDEDDSEQHFHDKTTTDATIGDEYCEKIDSENCPQSVKMKRETNFEEKKETSSWKSADEYVKILLNQTIEMMDLIISMGLTSLTVLIFILGYYCINKTRKETPLIAKMNELERHLMATMKENEALAADLISTRQKLLSIEDNSFGSNDMVISLKKDLEVSEQTKQELLEKIVSLEKELEAAAEDGLELNRMVSELLNNQTGSDSIISSVEDLQRQLNEQQETIFTMNEALATKSRENSELQVQLSEISSRFNAEFQVTQQKVDSVALERSNLQIELENLKRESDIQVNQLIEERNNEVTRLNGELTSYAKKFEEKLKSLNAAESKVQSLEECLNAVKKDSKDGSFKDIFDVADLKADLLAVTKEKNNLQEKLQSEKDARKLLEDRVQLISDEMSKLKKEFGNAEKEKLEAQTRLEVLSTYFKEKETQLQQELSVKEARWMKQQGETTTTVEKVQSLNDEIQSLKSQKDSLHAEIEAQFAAHKLNISSLEAQSHAAWLNARQAERKLEESRMESAALRRRLTLIAENPAGASDLINGLPGMINDTMNSIPSPIRVESPNNTNTMPPASMMMPPFLPQGFIPGAPPPFLPPPPFMHDMAPPPLGRLMSPPPKRFTPTMRDDRDRYSPRGRGKYSPDSRYDDYTAFETETDYSPPPSPSPPPRRGYHSPSDRSKKPKGNGNNRISSSSSDSSDDTW